MKNNYIKSERMWNVCLTYVYRMFYVISILFTFGVGQSWGKYIYLNLNSWTGWENQGDGVDPYFRVTFWKDGTSDTNYSLTSIGNHLYRADIGNESRTSMTFKRMRTNTETQWNYANMTIDGEKNVCVISGWDNSGAWGSYKISRVQGGYIYFDNSVTQWSGTIQFVIGHDDYGSGKYSRTYTMSQITGTQIWYVNLSDQSNHTWNDATYFAFIATDGKWEDKGWGSDNISNATNYTGIYSSPFDLNDGSTYMCTPSAAANGSSFSITYKSSGYSAIASTYTHNLYVYTRTQLDGSTPSYGTSLNSPTTVNIKGYQMTGNGASTQQTSSVTTSSNSTTRGSIISTSTVSSDYTALGANSAWTFDGWAVNTGGPSNTNSIYSITNAKAAKSIYAYFSKRTYTVSFNMHGYGDAVSDQVKDYYALVAQPSTPTTSSAYVFRGWWKESTYVNQWNFSSDHVTTTTTLHAKWLAYVNVAYNKGANGTGSNVTDKKVTGENLTLRGAIFTRTGYTQTGWSTTDGGAKAYNLSATYSTQSALNLYPFWTVNTYNITLNAGTGGSGSGSATVDYDATEYKTFSHNITQTGYHIEGWYDNGEKLKVLNDDGTFAGSSVSGYISSSKWCKASDCTLQAWWAPNNYTVTLDKQSSAPGHSADGSVGNQSVSYNTALPAISGTAPTALNDYAFMGFYTETGGAGVQVIDASLNWVASVEGYTSADSKWKHDGDVTLYAYYKQAEITGISFSTGNVIAPSTSTTVTATISPTPAGTTTVCWRVLHGNDNPLDEQPIFTPASGNSVSFTTSATSGTYKVEAVLHSGSGCGGTTLDSVTALFQVAGDHDVTVLFKDGSSNTIKASETVTGKPLEWTEVVAHKIFGYTYSGMTAGDGITLRDTTAARLTELQAIDPTIVAVKRMKAIYDGKLTINYVQNDMIYFKNTLGWSSVRVNFLDGDYWTANKGSGNKSKSNCNIAMTQIGETDIWYYDYGAASITPSKYIAFTQEDMNNYENFYQSSGVAHVVYPSRYLDALGADNANGLGFYSKTPMFVPYPLAEDAGTLQNDNKARYYNAGYWTKYTPGTGYTLEIYYSDGSTLREAIPFTSEDDLMPMKAVADLEAGQTYKFQIKRDGDVYYGNGSTMTYTNHGQSIAWEYNQGQGKTTFTATAAGDYTFNLGFSANSNKYRLRMSLEYPITAGDYRVIYDDAVQTNFKASNIITKQNNAKDTVSFFVRPGNTPVMKIQYSSINATTGAVTWNDKSTISSWVDNAGTNALSKDSVYNICLTMNGSGEISVENVEPYTGNYYIRTNAANSKWSNYRSDPDHLMTYSEYSINHGGYSHYYCHWVQTDDRKNIKFCIANDYSPSISDTLIRETATGDWANIGTFVESNGDIKRNANVRFMWNRHDNTIKRAYIDGAQESGSSFLQLLSDDSKIKNAASDAVLTAVTFSDNQNWIYEANVKAQPNAQIKLKSTWGTGGTVIMQYFKGSSSGTETLIGGSGTIWYDIRLLYDFKSNRLVASYVPASADINTATEINADIMFIREHQGDIAQLTFSGKGAISKIETAYGVIRFNKWTLNNKEKTGEHAVLSSPASVYERSLYWISFPFRVKLSEVFGFGTYGTHWAVQYYDGADRAARGHFLENGSFWRWMNRATDYLEPNQGYLLAIDVDLLGESSDVWGPNSLSERIELYFPSYGTMPSISSSNVTQTLPAHTCTINRNLTEGLPDTGDPRTSYNRTVFDSHWNVMSVPTYVNSDDITFANTTWITEKTSTAVGPKFLYTWNADDNTITATSGSRYTYHAMHSYMVQYSGNVTWSAKSSSPSPIVARKTYEEQPREIELRLELQQNEKMIDRTYIIMSNDGEVSANFAFGEDMTKEFNKNKAAIFNYTADHMGVAGNTMPMSDQTTIVPIGIDIPTAGDFTFAIPDGTSGVGVTLVDNETGIRTSLSALDYTVNLTAGTHDGRFLLEISPIHNAPTGIEEVTGNGLQVTGARKVLIDGILYIVKGDKLYDVRGTMIK